MALRRKAPLVHTVKRGTVVQLRDSQGRVYPGKGARGIVMGNTPPSNYYSRAYGREVYVCQVDRDPGFATVLRDAHKSGDKAKVKMLVERNTSVHEKNVTMVRAVGRVKKIPLACTLAMKIEKGKF
jgi:hypothetical protein